MTFVNIKIILHCHQESYLKSFCYSWMFLMCTLRCENEKMIIHKSHILNIFDLHEWFSSDTSLSKWFSTRATNEIFLIFLNGFYLPSNCICYIKFFTKVTNISIFVNRFYSSSNCICYIKIFTKVTNISNVTHVENHWHQLSSKPFTYVGSS